jgi:hypothetical protein
MATANNPFEQIILPANIPSAWPPAPIYWLICALLLIAISLLVVFAKRYQQRKKTVKQALVALQALEKQNADFAQLNQLLKGLCLQYYSRAQVASLTGKEWFIFIQQHSAHKKMPLFDDQDRFCQRLYQQQSIATSDDFREAKQWIKDFPSQVMILQKSIQVGRPNV